MNDKIHIRRTAAPVRTPRITTQSSNGYISPNQHIPFVSQPKNILPILPSSFDTSKIISINHSFHQFTDSIAYFLSHNGCIGSYRSQVSQNSTELERLFNSFYQAVLKYSSQKNYQTNPTIRSTGLSFLKSWQQFALSIVDLRRAGPGMITQSISAHFNTINTSLKTVMNYGISKSNVHDQSYRNGRVLQNRLNLLKASSDSFLDKSNNADELKRLSSEMKEFSRLLNETFAREFTQCGIAQNEVVRLRSKCYTACSDVIHGLKNSYLFQTNIIKLLQLLISFQDNLRDLLDKLNLPTNYLISIDLGSSLSDNPNIEDDAKSEEEEEEIDELISFDENLPLPDFIRDSQERSSSFIRNQQSGDRFFGILNTKVSDLLSEMSERKAVETDQQKVAKDECERLKRENKLLIQERKVFMDEADDLKIECDNLKETINRMKCEIKNNEKKFTQIEKFQNALKQIAKINEEIDDDDLISQALKIHNDMIIKYNKYEENEQKLKKILKTDDIITETERLLLEISNTNRKMDQENDSITQFKINEQKLKEIFSQFSKLESPIDVANEISDSFKKLKHIVNCMSLSECVDSIYLLFSDIKESLLRMSNCTASEISTNLLVLAGNVENEINSSQKILKVALNDETPNTPLSKMAEAITSVQSRYHNGYKSILQILHQTNDADDIDLAAIKSIQKVQLTLNQIIEKLKQISGCSENSSTQKDLIAFHFLREIENKMNQYKETIDDLQKLCSEVETVLTSYTNDSISTNSKQSNSSKTIRILLKKLPQIENSKSRSENELKNFQKKIEMNLCKLTKSEMQDDKNRQDHIMSMIDQIGQFITSLHTRLGVIHGGFFEILDAIDNSKSEQKSDEIDKMFESVFDLVPVTSRSDPTQYIPEFCNAFVSLHNSVLSLKPFASILNQIFSQFDCKLQSFKPSTQSFQFIKGQIFNLHTALNNLAPSKVNSLIFLILSRFVALTSSFTAAISSASFDDGDPNMKETFFQMQMQLCKKEKMI